MWNAYKTLADSGMDDQYLPIDFSISMTNVYHEQWEPMGSGIIKNAFEH